MFQFTANFTSQDIYFCNAVDLVSEKFYTDRTVRIIGRKNLQYITPHTECTSMKIHFITIVLNVDQRFDHIISVFLHSRTK